MNQPAYVCGHSARELQRLELQGAFYEDITHAFLSRAGLAPGMRVIDIGCGVGDVSLLAAKLVGPQGWVTGIDHATDAVAWARARAARLGIGHVAFETGEIRDLAPAAPVDAIVGRFILMHQSDPADTLRRAARHVQSGGIVAMLESHMIASVAGGHSHPHAPTYDRVLQWMIAAIRAAGARPDMGLDLRRTFIAAGLPTPPLWLQGRAEGGPQTAIVRYTIESLRSMLPLAERCGIVSLSAAAVEEIERQLEDELVRGGGVLVSPLVVGAWSRLP